MKPPVSTKNIRQYPHFYFFLLFFLGLVLGIGIEWGISAWRSTPATYGIQKIHPFNNNYSFINPLLGFEISGQDFRQYDGLRNQINDFLQVPEIHTDIKNVSVYLRVLESGETMAINANDEFDPASLLKVPISDRILQNRGTSSGNFERNVCLY